jgi:hypothetical protein
MKEFSKGLPDLMAEMHNASNTKDGYGYKYAPLNEILDTVRPLLQKHRYSIVQMVGYLDGKVSVTTRLIHESGEFIESTMALPPAEVKGTNEVQQMGASITYARRYMLTSLLGIAGEEDTDGIPPVKREQTKRDTQPKAVDNLSDKMDKAVKMIDALISTASIPKTELEAINEHYDAVKAMDYSEEKYQAYRGLYSSIQKAIKNG